MVSILISISLIVITAQREAFIGIVAEILKCRIVGKRNFKGTNVRTQGFDINALGGFKTDIPFVRTNIASGSKYTTRQP